MLKHIWKLLLVFHQTTDPLRSKTTFSTYTSVQSAVREGKAGFLDMQEIRLVLLQPNCPSLGINLCYKEEKHHLALLQGKG